MSTVDTDRRAQFRRTNGSLVTFALESIVLVSIGLLTQSSFESGLAILLTSIVSSGLSVFIPLFAAIGGIAAIGTRLALSTQISVGVVTVILSGLSFLKLMWKQQDIGEI